MRTHVSVRHSSPPLHNVLAFTRGFLTRVMRLTQSLISSPILSLTRPLMHTSDINPTQPSNVNPAP